MLKFKNRPNFHPHILSKLLCCLYGSGIAQFTQKGG